MKPAFNRAVIGSPLLVVALCAPACARPITGRLVDENQKPLAHIPVSVWVFAGEGKNAVQKLSTNASGQFTANVSDAALAKAKTDHLLGQVNVVAPHYARAQVLWRTPDQKFVLFPGQSWGGVVLGDDEKPLAGVRVKLQSLRLAGQPETYGESDSTFKTDATGHWTMDSLPLQGSAQIAIFDPRFQAQVFDLPLSAPCAPPLFVKAGARVSGRLLSPDKKPLAGVLIDSFSASLASTHTDAAGRFTLSGFAPGDARLSSWDEPHSGKARDYIVTGQSVTGLKAGETRDIGDWIAQKGVLVTGQVVDSVTKKPLAGIAVTLMDSQSHDATTDAKGRFEARLSGTRQVSASLRSDDYLQRFVPSLSLDKNAERVELAPLELVRGVKIAGTARIEGGGQFDPNALQPFALTATRGRENFAGWGNADGTFSFSALEPGEYGLKTGAPPGYINIPNRFTLVSPGHFVVPPAKGKLVTPLQVVLKFAPQQTLPTEAGTSAQDSQAAPGTPTRLEGRVRDEAGQPVAGAIISFKNARNVFPALLVSGADGRFLMVALPTDSDLRLTNIERPGFIATQNAKVTREGDALIVSDVVLKRRGARFVGRVVDSEGRPMAGALVAPLGAGQVEPVLSAADGTFVLLDLPSGEFSLLAAKDRASARQTTSSSATNVELRLAPPAPVDVEALAQKWMARGPGWWGQSEFIPALGPDRIERMLLRKSLDANGQPIPGKAGEVFAWFLQTAAVRDPLWTRRHADELLSLFPEGELKRQAETPIAWARAASDDAGDQKWANAWLDRASAEKGGTDASTVGRFLDAVVVARALKRPEAATLLDFAAQVADQLPPKTQLDGALRWGELVAPSGERAVASFIENWPPLARFAAWSGAVRGFSRAGDTGAARHAMQTLDLLAKSADLKAVKLSEAEMHTYNTSPDLLLDGANIALARALAERDGAAALAQAGQVQDVFSRQNALLWMANSARVRGDKNTAVAAVREVFKISVGNSEPYALAAWYGAQLDPALGTELFNNARPRIEDKADSGPDHAGIGDLAYYFGRRDPALCRLLVEREWLARMSTLPPADKRRDPFDRSSHEPTKLVRAMLVIDPARASEMAAQLEAAEQGTPDGGSQRAHERIGWIVALVADEAAQARGDLEEREF